MAIKKSVKQGAALVVGGVVVLCGGKFAFDHGWIPKPASFASKAPSKMQTFAAGVGDSTPAPTKYDLSASPAPISGTPTALILPWMAEGSVIYANGGADTADGSLVKQYAGSPLKLTRQDDYGAMQTEMIKFATLRKQGQDTPSEGAAMTMIMGDGGPQYFAALEPKMEALGQHAVVIDVVGFSHGEDKCMMRPMKNNDPQSERGSLVAAVPRDGDQNICIKFASDNNLPVNPDNTVYDPGAINFVDTDSFTKADDDFVGHYCEDRDEAHAGVKTGKKVHVCVDGVATWTPGDVDVAKKRGGVVAVASTRDYDQQMPAVLIADKEWANAHRQYVVGLIKAFDRASFDIRGGKLARMGALDAQVWGKQSGGEEADPNYWTRYFVGEDFTDGQGNKVRLGGSRVITLSEARDYMGLSNGSLNVYKAVYDTFCNYDKTFYPQQMPSCPAYSDVVDTSFMQDALNGVQASSTPNTSFATQQAVSQTVSSKPFSIEFDSGKATIKPTKANLTALNSIMNMSGMTSLRINLNGHTDNTGDSEKNIALSRARAQAVASWLTQNAPNNFPANRFFIEGFGDTQPVASNDTAEGRAQNRRVEVVLGH